MNAEPAVLTTWDVKPEEPSTATVTTSTTEDEALTVDQLAALLKIEEAAARHRYREYRKRTRFWRRVWGGIAPDQRIVAKHGDDIRRSLVADARKVYGYVDFHLGGVEDIATIARGLGMKRGRVRLVLNLVKRGEAR